MDEEYTMIPSPVTMSRSSTPPLLASDDTQPVMRDLDVNSLFPHVEQESQVYLEK